MPESYKKLGSLVASDSKEYVLYSSPASTQSLVSNITVTNRSSSSAAFDINIYNENVGIQGSSLSTKLFLVAADTRSLVSRDGITWVAGTMPSSGSWKTTYGDGLFVSIQSTAVATSVDGITWTPGTLPAAMAIITYGEDLFVAVANNNETTARSTDGISWTLGTYPLARSWSDMQFGGGNFVAVGPFQYGMYSTDAITWAWSDPSLPNAPNLSAIAYGNNKFVVVCSGFSTRAAAYTADGSSWTATTMPTSQGWSGIAFGKNNFVAVSSATPGAISTDAITWTSVTLPTMTNIAFGLKVAFGNELFVATTIYQSNGAATSTNGITWTARTLPASGNWILGDYAENESVTSPPKNNLYKEYIIDPNETLVLEPGIALSPENSVVVKDNSTTSGFLYVTDNSNTGAYRLGNTGWTITTLPSSQRWYGVKYANGVFVAVAGYNANSSAAAYSTNGITWTATTLPVSTDWGWVAYGNNIFVTAGGSRFGVSTNVVAYSTNGITWTRSTVSIAASWRGITFGKGIFLLGGPYSFPNGAFARSTDAITWTFVTLPTYASTLAYGNDIFVYALRGSSQGGYSTDGITWTYTTLPTASGFTSHTWRNMIFGGGKFVVVNDRGSDNPTSIWAVGSSTDAITWTISTTPVPPLAIAYGGDQYSIVGPYSSSEAVSTDAITWTIGASTTNSSRKYSMDSFPVPGNLTFSAYGVELS